MNRFIEYLLLTVILLVFLILFVPKTEYFTSLNIDRSIAQSNAERKDMSTILYNRPEYQDKEQSFLDSILSFNPFSEEPLFMNRCIEFIHDPNKQTYGIDQVIEQLRSDGKIFVSNKITIEYHHFSTIQDRLQNYLMTLYSYTNDPKDTSSLTIPQFYGPAYVLLTQYPFLRGIKNNVQDQCDVYTIPLYTNAADIRYSPRILNTNVPCVEDANTINTRPLVCEMYVLLPAHVPGNIKDMTFSDGKKINFYTVGPRMYSTWSQIKCNMRRLFAFPTTNVSANMGVPVSNPRSHDNKCFVMCGDSPSSYGYVCGARNSTSKKDPYESNVFSTRKTTTDEFMKADYANLYLINARVLNKLMGVSTETGILQDYITVQPIDASFTTEDVKGSCETVIPITGPRLKLKDMQESAFVIRIGGTCLGVDFATKKIVPANCNGDLRTITWRSIPIKIYTSATYYDTFYKLYITIPGTDNKPERWFLSTGTTLTMKEPTIAFFPEEEGKLKYTDYTVSRTINKIGTVSRCLVYKIIGNKYDFAYDFCTINDSESFRSNATFEKVIDRELLETDMEPISENEVLKNINTVNYYYRNPSV